MHAQPIYILTRPTRAVGTLRRCASVGWHAIHSHAILLRLIAVVVISAGPISWAQASTSKAMSPPISCAALQNGGVPGGGAIALAQDVLPGSFHLPGPDPMAPKPVDYAALPAFCRVVGVLTPREDANIGFELWLPARGWNGRFLQVGNGGAAGVIVYSALADGLTRGYAVVNTDAGHIGMPGEFTWAQSHPGKIKDFGYRAVHEVTVAARALTASYYGKAPSKAYWTGCSTGGREGLKEVQAFPNDYDAVVAGAPANNWGPEMLLGMKLGRYIGTGDGLPVSKLGLLHDAFVAQCDAIDGVRDGVVTDPARCRFDPAALLCKSAPEASCLSPAELAAARHAYAGVVDSSGNAVYPGTGGGSEPQWAAYASPQFRIGYSFLENTVSSPPMAASVGDNLDALLPQLQAASIDINATNADIRPFTAHGGKLLLYHGTIDGLIPFENTKNYYLSVVAQLGAREAERHVRFFSVPGMTHCFGGDGAGEVDWLAALERWDQTHRAPDILVGDHLDKTKHFSRPVCAYPKHQHYNGHGNVDDAANWTCS